MFCSISTGVTHGLSMPCLALLSQHEHTGFDQSMVHSETFLIPLVTEHSAIARRLLEWRANRQSIHARLTLWVCARLFGIFKTCHTLIVKSQVFFPSSQEGGRRQRFFVPRCDASSTCPGSHGERSLSEVIGSKRKAMHVQLLLCRESCR